MSVTPFATTITVFQVTKTISSAPKWVRHALQELINLNGSTNLDGGRVNKAQRLEAYTLMMRFGV